MRDALIVLWKELADGFRDRRSLTAAILYSLLGPAMIGLSLAYVAKNDEPAKAPALPVVEAGRAPALVEALRQSGVTILPAPADPREAVRRGEIEACMEIDSSYASDFVAGRPAKVRLVHDTSRPSSRLAARRLGDAIQSVSREVAAMRLMARGLSRSAASPIRLQEVDLATPRSRASIAMGMIPIFLLVAAFIGGMNVAIDVTAGERERGSLEPLLLTYVPARAVVIGKWLASAAFSLLGLAVCLAGSMAILRFVEMRILGLRAAIEPREALWMFLTVTPLALLAAAAQMLLSTSSRSFKEAQTYVSILIFLPMLPGFLLQFQSLEREGWMGLVPLFGHQILLDDLLKGSVDTAAAVSALGCTLLTLAGAGICLGVNTRLLRSERIIHGR